MKSDTYATCAWMQSRQDILAQIERQIDELLDDAAAGCFIVDVHGPYGSRNENTKELKGI